VKRENRRRRGGNVGPDGVGIQARREGGKLGVGVFPAFLGAAFPRRPARPSPVGEVGREGHTQRRRFDLRVRGEVARFFAEVKS